MADKQPQPTDSSVTRARTGASTGSSTRVRVTPSEAPGVGDAAARSGSSRLDIQSLGISSIGVAGAVNAGASLPAASNSSSGNSSSGNSVSGSSASGNSGAGRPDNQDKTVISKRPPTAPEPGPLTTASSPGEMGRSLQGRQLGHFQLEEFVGGGGMGAVFRATDMRLSRTVAVKVLSRDRTDEDTLRRFQNEAQSAARLDHPNIARVYYVGEDQGLNYIVFEYIEGANIRDLVVQRGPLPLEEAISYTLQLAEALDHAAQRDVVHRDIKPSNVLVMGSGHVKLVDMGLARLHQVEASNEDLTATGVTLGTFDYISPEQARDPRSADVRSDLYSLGCTLYFMLAGRPPFPDGTVLQKLLSHSSDPPPDVRSFRPELPEEVSAILGKLLAKQPAQRFQEPSELIGALLLLADNAGLDRVSKSGKVWIATHETGWNVFERHLPWVVPLLLLILVVVWLQWSRRGPADVATRPARPVYPTAPGPAATSQPTALPLNRPNARERDGVGESGAGATRGRSTSDRDGNRLNPESGMNRSDDGSRETGERNDPSRGDSGRADSSRDESGRGDGARGDMTRAEMNRSDMKGAEPNRAEPNRGSDGDRRPTEAAAVEVRDGGSTAPSGGAGAGAANSPASPTGGAAGGNANSSTPSSPAPGIGAASAGSTLPPMTLQPMSLQPMATQPASNQPMPFQPTTPLTAQSQPNSSPSNQASQPSPSAAGQGVSGQGASGPVAAGQGSALQGAAGQAAAQPTTTSPMVGSPAPPLSGSAQPGSAQPSPTAIGGANPSGSQSAGADERSRSDDRTDRDERPAGRTVGDPATGVVVKRLVVGPFDPKWEQVGEVRQFSSLSEAVRATLELPEVDTIELHYDGERMSEPLDVSPPSRRLTIRAGAGHTPIVHFKPEEAELVTDRRLIRVVHSAVSFNRVQLVVTLPSEPYDDWALFYLDRATRVELNDATLTLRNTERGGVPLHRAAFFEFSAPQAAETMMDMKNVRDAAPPWVNLQNCIARGQATLVRATSGVPFRLTWNQGLFVSTESLVQTAGARTQPQPSEGIGIELSQVTVAIGRTLCLMRIEPGARFPLELVTKFNNCIFLESAGARGDGAPLTLVEQQYAVGIEPTRKRPFLSGAGNYYPNDTVLLRIAPAGQPGGAVEYSLQDRDEARQEKWYDEQPSVGMVMWKQLPDSSAPVDRLTKDDFQLDDAPNNPAARAGFDRKSLPETGR